MSFFPLFPPFFSLTTAGDRSLSYPPHERQRRFFFFMTVGMPVSELPVRVQKGTGFSLFFMQRAKQTLFPLQNFRSFFSSSPGPPPRSRKFREFPPELLPSRRNFCLSKSVFLLFLSSFEKLAYLFSFYVSTDPFPFLRTPLFSLSLVLPPPVWGPPFFPPRTRKKIDFLAPGQDNPLSPPFFSLESLPLTVEPIYSGLILFFLFIKK